MVFVLKHKPLQFLVFAPLNERCVLIAHEIQLLAWVCHMIHGKCSHPGELAPHVARHPANQRLLPMYHLIVGQRQNIILTVCICHGKSHLVVIIFPIDEICAHVVQSIIHPSHVPFEVESQTSHFRRTGYQRKCTAFFCDSKSAREITSNHLIELTDEAYCIKICIASILVIYEISLVSLAEIQIQHTGNTVHTKSVSVILFHPERSIGHQEASHFTSAEIKLVCAPFRMYLLLVKHAAVKRCQTVCIGTEVTRYPVENHTNACLMASVDKPHQSSRLSVSGCCSEITRNLIPPGCIERMLHNRH